MSVPSRLKSFLDANRVPYESLSHSTTYTAQGTATVMQISGREMAKTVVLRAGEHGNAGTHRDVVRMTYEDFVRLAKPKICAFV